MNNLRSLIWTIVGIVVFVAIIRFAFFMIPYVLVISLLAYIIFKIKKYFGINKKSDDNINNTYNSSYSESTKTYTEDGIDDDLDNGKVIDVDYKEVDK